MRTVLARRAAAILAAIILLAADSAITSRVTIAWQAADRQADAPVLATTDGDPLLQFRTEREQLRARQAAQLNEIIYDEDTDAETLRQAQRRLMDMQAEAASEVTLEGILQARGFDGALVSVGRQSVNVLLRCEAVTQRQASVILDLVLRETGVTGGNVKIIPVN